MIKHVTRLFSVILILTSSCDVSYLDKPIDENITITSSLQFPIGSISYSLSELFEKAGATGFNTSSSEELSFLYTQSFSSDNDSEFDVQIPQTQISRSIATPVTNQDINPFSFPFTLTDVPEILNEKSIHNIVVHDLELSQQLTGLSFSGGEMLISLKSTFDAETLITLQIPSLSNKTTNNSYSETMLMGGNSTTTISLDLAEYDANLTHDGSSFDQIHNSFVIILDGSFNFSSGNVLYADDHITFDVSMSNASPSVVYGDFKQENISTQSQSFSLDLFDNFNDGEISFTNPSMTITASSGYGFPIGIDLSGIKAITSAGAQELSYVGDNSLPNTLIIDGLEDITAPKKTTTRVLNSENSNIVELLESKPTAIQLEISGTANPIDMNPNKNFYVSDRDGLSAEVSIAFNGVTVTEEFDFSFEEDINEIKQMKLIAAVENKVPVSVNVVVNFKNATGTVYSKNLNILEAANITQTGTSDGNPKRTDFSIVLDYDDIQNISNATQVDVQLTLSLPDGEQKVLLSADDDISIYLGASVNVEIEAN